MIPELFAGEGRFSGPTGFAPFHEELSKWREDYGPINEQLGHDREENRDELFRLRDAAAVHLWPQLHGEWLPRLLEEGSSFAQAFVHHIDTALRLAPLAKFLNLDAQSSVAVGSAAGVACSSLLYAVGALTGEDIGRTAVVVTGSAGAVATLAHDHLRRNYGPLALFYHAAIHKRGPNSR